MLILLRRVKHSIPQSFFLLRQIGFANSDLTVRSYLSGPASSPSLSIWRRKKEMSKEGLIAAKELKRLQTKLVRLDRFISSHVSRLLKSDLVSVLAEFQRQDQVFLCMKVNQISIAFWNKFRFFFNV